MRNRFFLILLCSLLFSTLNYGQDQKPATKTYVLKAARLFDGKSNTLATPGVVVITGGKIELLIEAIPFEMMTIMGAGSGALRLTTARYFTPSGRSIQAKGIDPDILNVNGGAIAIGHPFGMTGSRMDGTIANEMLRRKVRYGVVTMCVGGGQGAAGLFETAN